MGWTIDMALLKKVVCKKKGWEYREGITEVPCNTASAFTAVPTAGVPLPCVFRLFLDKVCSM